MDVTVTYVSKEHPLIPKGRKTFRSRRNFSMTEVSLLIDCFGRRRLSPLCSIFVSMSSSELLDSNETTNAGTEEKDTKLGLLLLPLEFASNEGKVVRPKEGKASGSPETVTNSSSEVSLFLGPTDVTR